MNKGVQIKYINFGIACRVKNRVYLNKKLLKKKWKKLHDVILEHELSHSEGFNKKDMINDINNYELDPVKKEYSSFVTSTPSAWVEYLPLWVYDGNLVLSPGMFSIWLFVIVVVSLSIYF
ncbi:MAG: hypothetical protein ACOC5T_05355 [Elusimicrobiota bacterium]